jgi:hypothetical protein
MGIRPETYYRPHCDTCKSDYEDPADWGIVAFGLPSDATQAAKDAGWQHDPDAATLTCPICLRCELCGEHPARVGGPEIDDHGRVLCDDCELAPAEKPGPRTLFLINGSGG